MDRRPANGMLQYCAERDIKLFTYGTVGGGLLSDTYFEEPKAGLLGGIVGGGKPRYSPIDLNTSSLKMFWRSVELSGGQEVYRELLSALKKVAGAWRLPRGLGGWEREEWVPDARRCNFCLSWSEP